jgi:cytochrome c-type biogenesis protein CcmE
MKNGRFLVGLVGVALVVTYLVWTGVSETMVYYVTPTELLAKVDADPSFREVGVKVSGKLVPGSYSKGEGELLHRFEVMDLENNEVRFPVEYRDPLPDTFHGVDVQVVLEGRFDERGVFQATTVLTKCGSRYEAAPEDLKGYGDAEAGSAEAYP